MDDATGEQLAYAVSQLLDMGAHDAWLSPILMKKGRPGTTVHVLCDPADADRLRALLRAETGTLGVRTVMPFASRSHRVASKPSSMTWPGPLGTPVFPSGRRPGGRRRPGAPSKSKGTKETKRSKGTNHRTGTGTRTQRHSGSDDPTRSGRGHLTGAVTSPRDSP